MVAKILFKITFGLTRSEFQNSVVDTCVSGTITICTAQLITHFHEFSCGLGLSCGSCSDLSCSSGLMESFADIYTMTQA